MVLERIYDGYGIMIDRETNRSFTDPFGYRGEYQDAESGYIYLRNRYLDPTTGRFITEDPIRDGLNWFIYCENNPINRVDPSGLISYIIYEQGAISGDGKHTFDDEAQIRKKQLEQEWKTEVYLLPVSNAKEFEQIWNYRVGYDWDGYDVPIEEVVIIAHGSIEGIKRKSAQSFLYFGNKDSKVYALSNFDGDSDNIVVNNLVSKRMKWLTFSTCNSGNPDVYNLAYAFKLQMAVDKFITAWDGGTYYNYQYEVLMPGTGWQPTWNKYVDKTWYGVPKRQRLGRREIKGY